MSMSAATTARRPEPQGIPGAAVSPGHHSVQVSASSPAFAARLGRVLDAGCFRISSDSVAPELLCEAVLDSTDLLVVGVETDVKGVTRHLRRLRLALAGTRVILVGRLGDCATRGSLRDPVDGLVRLDQVESTLVPAAQAVLADQVVVPRSERRLLAPVLSRRERQVLALMSLGASNPAIAERLYLSQSTVKSHLTSAFAKLGVGTRNEATVLVLDPDDSIGTMVMASLDSVQVDGDQP